MNIREKVAERIQIARKKIGITQSELADGCGFSRGRVSNWENASRMPKAEEIHTLAKVLKVSPSWLFCATDDFSEYETYSGQLFVVPIFDLNELAKPDTFAMLADKDKRANYIKNNKVLVLSPDKNISENAKTFAVNISDNSMEPEILQEDILVVDPDATPAPSKYVLAKINDQFIIRKFRKPSNNQIELASINQDWPNHTFQTEDASVQIIGTVVELRRAL